MEISDVPFASPDALKYTGTWERNGRSLNAAALAGLLGIGILYSYGGSIVATIAVLSQGEPVTAFEQGDNLLSLLAQKAELAKNPIRISLICSQVFLMLLPTLWVVKRWHTVDVCKYLRFQGTSPVSLGLAVLTMIFFFPANIYISELLTGALHIPQELIDINEKIFKASSVGELIFVMVAIGLTPALCEEILFRGYGQRTFERTMGWKSILLVGVVFGLYHMQPLGLFTLSGLGILFGYFYFASKSLLPGMAAHFTNNVLVVLFLYFSPAIGGVDLVAGAGWVVILTLPLAVVTLYLFHRTLNGTAAMPEVTARIIEAGDEGLELPDTDL